MYPKSGPERRWCTEKVAKKEICVVKVPSEENLADALTKAVDSETLKFHIKGVGAEVRNDRHEMAPKIEDAGSEE